MRKKPSLVQSRGVASEDFLRVKNKTSEIFVLHVSQTSCLANLLKGVFGHVPDETGVFDGRRYATPMLVTARRLVRPAQPTHFFFWVARDHSVNDAVACVMYTSGGQPTHMPRCRF